MDSQNNIEFSFTRPHRFVRCYKKVDVYDVYVDQFLIKSGASLDWVNQFKSLMKVK